MISKVKIDKFRSTKGIKAIPIHDHSGIRRSGKTTRRIDSYIQELFTKGEIIVTDTHVIGISPYNQRKLDKDIFSRIVLRLEIEHTGNDFIINTEKLLIKLVR